MDGDLTAYNSKNFSKKRGPNILLGVLPLDHHLCNLFLIKICQDFFYLYDVITASIYK
jgi:hypothetical protein